MIKVLIVDDEISILNGLRNNIKWEEFGMDIVGTEVNGQAALELIRQQEVNLLITDVCMPGMNGLELIAEAKKVRKDIHCVLISAYNEFEYVHKAIHLGIVEYLLKPLNMKDLSETLEKVIEDFNKDQLIQTDSFKNVEVFRESLLNRWVSGSINYFKLCERANLAKVNVYAKEYCVIMIKLLEYPENELPEMMDKINEELRKILENITNAYIFVNAVGQSIALVHGNMLLDVFAKIKSSLEGPLLSYCRSFGINVFIVIGEVVNGSENVNRSYLSACKLLDYSLLKASNEVLCAEDLKNSLTEKYISTPDFNDFERLIRDMDLEGCLSFLDSLLLRFDKIGHIDLPQSKTIIIELLFSILTIVREAFSDNEALPATFKNLFYEFGNITVYDYLKKWLYKTVEEAILCIREKLSNISPIIHLVLNYIDSNYNQEISIKTLADRFNVTAPYLGQIFKKETGKIFTNYLNDLRMGYAIQMLSCTQLKIQEIAQKVGYTNTSYFNQIFRNLHVVTPVQYRINLMQKNQNE